MDNNRQTQHQSLAADGSVQRAAPSLPAAARLPLNRCNLPAVILGSLTFQQHPVPLEIDGIRAFHSDIFAALAGIEEHAERAQCFQDYLSEGCAGLYGTNALEAQLDLLYTYCQYELALAHPRETHLRLYRGINRIDEHEVLERRAAGCYLVLLNNLNSFTLNRERADEFGDYILEVQVPLPKVFFYNRLLPGMLKGEDEVVVIGGVCEVRIGTY
jgi:hypothetical protein